jgi:peptidoglycan/LPS O-acetylase OafA/YrhL
MYLFSLGVLFALALTLPLLALAFFWLAERYSAKLAYCVLALIPLVCFFLLLKFQGSLGHATDTLLPQTIWLSLITFVFGISLVIRSYRKRQGWKILLIASIVSSVPLVLVVLMFYRMSQDEYLKHL